MNAPLIEVRNVTRQFAKRLDFAGKIARSLGAKLRDEIVHAVDDVSLIVPEQTVVGLVGESGCGKSTLGRMIAGVDKPTAGQILYRGNDMNALSGEEAVHAALKVQMIFQDPLSSLNPRLRMREIVGEAVSYHGIVPPAELEQHIDTTLLRCGLSPALKGSYPHQFSGGQRQRIGIARALAVSPELIVCDEAVAALDVSLQAQIINLFMKLRKDFGLSYLFVSHDISVVRHISDYVYVMYLGRVVESGPSAKLFAAPLHPYTKALLNETPKFSSRRTEFQPIRGEIPSPLDPPPGCHFHPRCPQATEQCRQQKPELR
ncbi:ABC transporter ATP-binding protein, partial [Desulfovibrio sp. OttesenSCG-928-I05]|nr:ABC transporter ATP-binding protein [Desulfovibrio sp. OttesenSCG-928-I05]